MKQVLFTPNNLSTGISIGDSEIKEDWRLTIGPNFGVDKNGNLYVNNGHFSGNISGGTIDASEVTFSAYAADDATKGGGFRCATGSDGKTTTYGAMMYGGTTDTNYFIATDGGVRMTSGGETVNEVYCSDVYTVMRAKNSAVYSSISITPNAITTTQS